MNSKVVPSRVLLVFFFFFFFVHFLSSNAFNITELLNQHPDFSSFNNALTQTQVTSLINSRQTLTVLALDNGAMSGVSTSQDTLKAILSLHVILDYFDQQKLQNMAEKSTILTTLYQTTGQASGMQGFLNVTITNGGVMIGSAVPGSSLGSSLVKLVASQPYNISVLQVSSAIVPPDFGGHTNSSSSAPSPPPPGGSSPPASSPKTSPIIPLPPKFGNAPTPSAAKTPTPAPPNANATAPSAAGTMPPSGAGATPPSGAAATPPASATSPSDATATTPAGATAPSDASANSPASAMPVVPGNAPFGSPPMPAGAGPVADGPIADAPAGGSSASGRSYHSVDHASILIMSLAMIWSVAMSI